MGDLEFDGELEERIRAAQRSGDQEELTAPPVESEEQKLQQELLTALTDFRRAAYNSSDEAQQQAASRLNPETQRILLNALRIIKDNLWGKE